MPFSASKQVVKPPQRGIFPLDHDAECRPAMQEYVKCLKDQDSNHHKCRELSKNYLQCRMDNELMAKENLEEIGFAEDIHIESPTNYEGLKEKEGFTAGKHIRKRRPWFWENP